MNETPKSNQENPAGLAPGHDSTSRRKPFLGKLLGWGMMAGVVVTALLAWRWCSSHPSTNDAVIAADTIGVVSRVSGPIKQLLVTDNQAVKKDDILFVIDEEPYKLAVAAAKSNLAASEGDLRNSKSSITSQGNEADAAAASLKQAQAALATAQDNYNRTAPLLAKHFVSQQDVDNALHSVEGSKASVAAAEARMLAAQSGVQNISAAQARRDSAAVTLAQAELSLKYCTVRAPFDGFVAGLEISEGNYATMGTPLFRLIDAGSWHIEAAFRETDLQKIKPGDEALLEIKTAPGRTFHGTVQSIVWGATPKPEDPVPGLPVVQRNLDWVKLAQRFPVKIVPKDIPSECLRIGATASATIAPVR
jgi:multidrug efflux system membrane fusion protein